MLRHAPPNLGRIPVESRSPPPPKPLDSFGSTAGRIGPEWSNVSGLSDQSMGLRLPRHVDVQYICGGSEQASIIYLLRIWASQQHRLSKQAFLAHADNAHYQNSRSSDRNRADAKRRPNESEMSIGFAALKREKASLTNQLQQANENHVKELGLRSFGRQDTSAWIRQHRSWRNTLSRQQASHCSKTRPKWSEWSNQQNDQIDPMIPIRVVVESIWMDKSIRAPTSIRMTKSIRMVRVKLICWSNRANRSDWTKIDLSNKSIWDIKSVRMVKSTNNTNESK